MIASFVQSRADRVIARSVCIARASRDGAGKDLWSAGKGIENSAERNGAKSTPRVRRTRACGLTAEIAVDCDPTTQTASVVWRAAFEPYGSVVWASNATGDPAPALAMGHKGLFVERLDAPPAVWFWNDDTRLDPEADLLVLMRNRQYLPRLGRFLQPDPNASGVAVQPSLAFGGETTLRPMPFVKLDTWAADGTNPLAYSKSDPVNGGDPTGLFFDGLLGTLFSARSVADLQSDWSQEVLDHGMTVFSTLSSEFAEAGQWQWLAAEIALDWGVADQHLGTDTTAAGGYNFNDPFRDRPEAQGTGDWSDVFVPLFAARSPNDWDHLVPRFSGGTNHNDNYYHLFRSYHTGRPGTGGLNRTVHLNHLLGKAGLPFPKRGLNSAKWQALMKSREMADPYLYRKWFECLLENAKYVDTLIGSTDYSNAMRRAIRLNPTPWR